MHNIDRVFVWTLEVKLNEFNKHETIDNAKVPLALVKRQKLITLYKTIDYGCA
jgi:hypothetical protein